MARILPPIAARLRLAATLGGLVLLAGAAPLAAQTPPAPAPGASDSPSLLETLNRGSLRSVLRPSADLKLSARAAGFIERFHVTEGSPVKAGEPIVSLDADMEKAQVVQAEAMLRGAQADFERAQAEFDRVKPLASEGIYSEKQFIEAKTNVGITLSKLEQAEANLGIAKASLTNRTISSPIDGIFLKSNKSVGEAVERYEVVARVVDVSVLEMVVYCDARLFPSFHGRTDAQIRILRSPDDQPVVPAKVSHVDPVIDPSSGTFRVKLSIIPSADAASGLSAVLIPPAN